MGFACVLSTWEGPGRVGARDYLRAYLRTSGQGPPLGRLLACSGLSELGFDVWRSHYSSGSMLTRQGKLQTRPSILPIC